MLITEYKFNNSSGNLLPTFNTGFSYTYEDTVEGTTTTRIIYADEHPTEISFMQKKNLLEINKLYTDNITSMYGMFYQCTSLTYVNFNYSDTSKVETIEGLFNTCSKLATIDGLNTLDVSNVNNMGGVFSGCSSLTEIDVADWDVSKVTNFGATFRGCSKATVIDTSKWKAKQVGRIGGMFQTCSKLISVDLSGFDLSNTLLEAGPAQAFYSCTSLTSLDISNWILPSDMSISNIFYNCNALQSVKMYDSDYITINKIVGALPTKTSSSPGDIKIIGISDKDLIDMTAAENKYWRITSNDINNFKIGDIDINKINIGITPVRRVYQGETLIYHKEPSHSPATEIKQEQIEYDIEEEVTFDEDGDYIDTGVDLFEPGNDWSVLIDFDDHGYAEPVNSLFILHNFYEGPNGELYGFNIQKTGTAQGSRLSFQVNENYYATKTLNNGINTRLVVVYNYPNTLTMYYNDPEIDAHLNANGKFQFNFGEFHDVIGCNLHLACWYNESQGGVGRFWRGEINEFVTWTGTALTEQEALYALNNKK